MGKFKYVGKAADGTVSSISPDIILVKLLQKTIASVTRNATDDKFFAISLSDDSMISFKMGDADCEIRFDPPDTK